MRIKTAVSDVLDMRLFLSLTSYTIGNPIRSHILSKLAVFHELGTNSTRTLLTTEIKRTLTQHHAY